MLYVGASAAASRGCRKHQHYRKAKRQHVRGEARFPDRLRQATAGPVFPAGQSGNPRGPRRKDQSSLLTAALNEPVYATIDGKRRKITKREAIVTQMVNESAGANLRATKMLFDMIKEVEQKAGAAAPPEPAKLTATDREVVDLFVARLRRQIAAEAAEAAAADPSEPPG